MENYFMHFKLIKLRFLKLLNNVEQDDKLIAIAEESPLAELSNLDELRQSFPGITEIIEIWFTNYKGQGAMSSQGYGDGKEAYQILEIALKAFL